MHLSLSLSFIHSRSFALLIPIIIDDRENIGSFLFIFAASPNQKNE
jgi:hypothetical protein